MKSAQKGPGGPGKTKPKSASRSSLGLKSAQRNGVRERGPDTGGGKLRPGAAKTLR